MVGVTRLNILFFGAENSGKSALLRRIVTNKFPSRKEPTVGIDFCTWTLPLDNSIPTTMAKSPITLQFFDLGGNDAYKEVRLEFYKSDAQIHAALLCFDASNRESFESIDVWYEEARSGGLAADSIDVTLCACQTDQQPRIVTSDEGREWAEKRSIAYYETSASIGIGHKEIISHLISTGLEKCSQR
jgi:Ras-related protein Rab-18